MSAFLPFAILLPLFAAPVALIIYLSNGGCWHIRAARKRKSRAPINWNEVRGKKHARR